MQYQRLSSEHYAADWGISETGRFGKVKEVNQLGQKYALAKDGPSREVLLLQVMRYFHPYLMKYLDMITRGHLPSFRDKVSKDTLTFLGYLLKKGEAAPRQSDYLKIARSLHLAFKQHDADDIYDVLALCLLRAIRRYDPHYTDRIKRVVEVIDETVSAQVLTAAYVSRRVGFNSFGCLRLLARHGFLAMVKGENEKVLEYQRASWPPPSKFFQVGAIGFTYFIQKWFHFYLKEHLDRVMGQLESKEGVLQLDYRPGYGMSASYDCKGERPIPSEDGDIQDAKGRTWAGDMSLVRMPLDVAKINLDWVRKTDDPLFSRLTRNQRYLIYLRFSEEKTWPEIARTLCRDVGGTRELYHRLLGMLRAMTRAPETAKTAHTNQ